MFDFDVLYAIPLAYHRWASRRSQQYQPRIPVPAAWNYLLRFVYYIAAAALTAFSIFVLATGTSAAVRAAAAVVLLSCILHISGLFAVDANGRNGSDKRRNLLLIPVLVGPFLPFSVLSLVPAGMPYYGIQRVQELMLLVVAGFVLLNLLNLGAHRRWALYRLGLEK